MTIRARKLTNGKTVYDITVYDSKDRVYRTAYSLADARATEAELKAQHSQHDAHRDVITLQRYIYSMYWPLALKRLSATSLDTYEKEIRLRIIPSLGKLKLRDVNRPAIQTLMVDRCETECVARKSLGVLKTILNEAINDGYIKQNYACSKFAMPIEGKQRDNGLVLSSFQEIHDMLSIVDSRGSVCIQRIAYSGLLQGLRPEERYALDWECFDMRHRTITISQARVYAQHGGVQDKETKTKHSTRVIPMHPKFYELLQTTPSNHDGAFILGADGKRISPSTARKRWSKFLRDNPECPPVTIENMRHSFATAYLAAGGKIEVLSRILGHSNISTTINKYFRPDVDLLRADLDFVACK